MRIALAAFVLVAGCESPFLQTIDTVEPANDGGRDCAPAPPTELTTQYLPGEERVEMRWQLADNLHDGVLIERRATGGVWGELVRLAPGTNRFDDFAIGFDAEFEYRVTTFRNVNDSVCPSITTNISGEMTRPNPVTTLVASFSAGTITVTWVDANATSDDYVVERSIDGGDWVELANTIETRYVDDATTPDAQVDYRVSARNAAGSSNFSTVGLETPQPPTAEWSGVVELSKDCSLDVVGSVSTDTSRGVTFDSAQGSSSMLSGVSAGPTGVTGVLTSLDPQTFDVAWTVRDSSNYELELSQSIETTTATSFRVTDVPAAEFDEVSGPGVQPMLPGCSTCSGETASIAVGDRHACVVNEPMGTVSCWGDNGKGQLGLGPTDRAVNPIPVCSDAECTQGFAAESLSVGATSSCALRDGGVWCWGEADSGQLGNGVDESSARFDEYRPVPVCTEDGGTGCTPLGNVLEISTYSGSSSSGTHCALVDAGPTNEVFCWGANSGNRLGVEATFSITRAQRVCVTGDDVTGDCVPLTGATRLSVGGEHQCALMEDSSVRCWGRNFYGELGSGDWTSSQLRPQPVCNSGIYDGIECGVGDDRLTGIDDVAAGDNFSCALTADDRVLCWGVNGSGEVGAGTTVAEYYNPVPVCLSGTWDGTECLGGAVLDDAQSLHIGPHGACAIRADSSAVCWGSHTNVGHGNDSDDDALLPQEICASGSDPDGLGCDDGSGARTALLGIQDIALGRGLLCVVVGVEREVRCVYNGFNWSTLGRGYVGFDDAVLPTPICAEGSGETCVPLRDVASLSVGVALGCHINAAGDAECWGYGPRGLLGGSAPAESLTPRTVCASGSFGNCTPLTGVRSVATSDRTTCAVLESGEPLCWGDNIEGDAGFGLFTPSFVSFGLPQHLCGEGRVLGDRCSGEFGDAPPLSGFRQIVGEGSSGVSSLCAIGEQGAVYCWGSNYDDQAGHRFAESIVPNPGRVRCGLDEEVCDETGAFLEGFVSVATGFFHNCAIHESGEVYCWGFGERAQLGNGLQANSSLPVRAVLPVAAVSLSLASESTCAVGIDQRLYCWGGDAFGQLGNGAQFADIALLPEPVCETVVDNECVPLEGVTASAGRFGTHCAVLNDGTVRCWGSAEAGIMGDGTRRFGTNVLESLPVRPCASDSSPNCTDDYVCNGFLEERFVAIDVGRHLVCGVTEDQRVICWGANTSGTGRGVDYGGGTSDQCTPTEVCAVDDPSCGAILTSANRRVCEIVSAEVVP